MRFLVIAALVGCAFAAPDRPPVLPGYGPSGGAVLSAGPVVLQSQGSFASSQPAGYGPAQPAGYGPVQPTYGPQVSCGPGQGPDGLGGCADALVTRNVFVYAAPYVPQGPKPAPVAVRPKIDYNIVVVNTPEQEEGQTVVIPPPQQRTIVYVLTKQDTLEQQVIEVPGTPGLAPEVFYVTYKDGEDRQLQGGLTLQQVLQQAGQQGSVIGGSGGSLGSGGSGVILAGGGAGGSGGYGGSVLVSGGVSGGSGVVLSGGGAGGSGGYGNPSY